MHQTKLSYILNKSWLILTCEIFSHKPYFYDSITLINLGLWSIFTQTKITRERITILLNNWGINNV